MGRFSDLLSLSLPFFILLYKSSIKCGIISSINKNLTVNSHSTTGLLLLTKPMVGVFNAK